MLTLLVIILSFVVFVHSERNDSQSSMSLLKLPRENDGESIMMRSTSSKNVRVHIDSDDDIVSQNDTVSEASSNDSAFSNGQIFNRLDLSIKLPKFGVVKVIGLSFLVVYTLVS